LLALLLLKESVDGKRGETNYDNHRSNNSGGNIRILRLFGFRRGYRNGRLSFLFFLFRLIIRLIRGRLSRAFLRGRRLFYRGFLLRRGSFGRRRFGSRGLGRCILHLKRWLGFRRCRQLLVLIFGLHYPYILT
jgi:hypothetical protein